MGTAHECGRGSLPRSHAGRCADTCSPSARRPEHAKSGEGRYIPLNSEAVDVLKRWRKQHAGPRVFPIADAKTAWAGLLTQAKIHNFRFHDLRHDFASRLVMAGVSLYVVKQLLGHASLKTTEAYAHLAPSAMTAAVEALTR